MTPLFPGFPKLSKSGRPNFHPWRSMYWRFRYVSARPLLAHQDWYRPVFTTPQPEMSARCIGSVGVILVTWVGQGARRAPEWPRVDEGTSGPRLPSPRTSVSQLGLRNAPLRQIGTIPGESAARHLA